MRKDEKTCFIVGAGSFSGMCVVPEADDLVIAADGGYEYLKQLKIEPQVLMGDFDSLEIVPEHKNLIRHSPIKDDTDMALAVAYGKAQGYERFIIYGGLGGRLDHTIANLQLLTGMTREGLEAYLIGEGIIITAITGEDESLSSDSRDRNGRKRSARSQIAFDSSARGMFSVFCMGEKASGVYEKGVKYPLHDAVLTCDRALGVSNEFLGMEAGISVKSGTLLVMWNEENGLPRTE